MLSLGINQLYDYDVISFDNQQVKMENNLEYTPNFEKNRSKFIRVVAFYLQNNVVNIFTLHKHKFHKPIRIIQK